MEEIKLIDIATPKKLKETLNQLRTEGKGVTEEEKAYWNAKVDPTQLERLQQELNTKASAEQLSSLAQTVGTKASQQSLDNLNIALQDKVNTDQFLALSQTVTTKASQQSVDTLSLAVQDKASVVYVEQLVGEINSLLDDINGEVI